MQLSRRTSSLGKRHFSPSASSDSLRSARSPSGRRLNRAYKVERREPVFRRRVLGSYPHPMECCRTSGLDIGIGSSETAHVDGEQKLTAARDGRQAWRTAAVHYKTPHVDIRLTPHRDKYFSALSQISSQGHSSNVDAADQITSGTCCES